MRHLPNDQRATCTDLDAFFDTHREHLVDDYAAGTTSFLPYLLPQQALAMTVPDVVEVLERRYSNAVTDVLEGTEVATSPVATGNGTDVRDGTQGTEVDSGTIGASLRNTAWLRRANVVGINVRTVGTFWRVVHYCLTLPESISAIHLLPIWEPGVVGSLYGMASWEINGEFFDKELAAHYPHLNTPTIQLKATVAVLHLCGRAVGMDVIPHTDRFSQIVLGRPALFEWLRRGQTRILDHRADLHEQVEDLVYEFALSRAPRTGLPPRGRFFTTEFKEAQRNRILFGDPEDRTARNARRGTLIRLLHNAGYEPVPATMGPPYRGIEVDPETQSVDSTGATWVDYRITSPGPMSRVFGPLARYRLYERLDDNRNWEIDFARPRPEVWDYVATHYDVVQREFGFDFMRGDMSHVQMRPDGVPAERPELYDLLGEVKRRIRARVPSFAYFAETFLSPPDVIAYGDELAHLEACEADVTLGDLQSVPVASDEFGQRLRRYLDIAATRTVTPSFTVMTADKDDPRFDGFYESGNELRVFCATFIPDLPSYTALGFETRDSHPEPAANEFYTKLYVFQVHTGSHATNGPYRFGRNAGLFLRIERIRLYAERTLPLLSRETAAWLLPPDATGGSKVIAWAIAHRGDGIDGRGDGMTVCVANCDTVAGATGVKVPVWPLAGDAGERIGDGALGIGDGALGTWRMAFSTVPGKTAEEPKSTNEALWIARIGRGEGRVYEWHAGGGHHE